MNFTQFLYPNGNKKSEWIGVAPELEVKARELNAAGFGFEIECHPDTQVVYADCCDVNGALASCVVANGPEMPNAIARLVEQAHTEWVRLGKPKTTDDWAENYFGGDEENE